MIHLIINSKNDDSKMFAVALFAALVAIASSAPQGGNTPVPILSSEFDQKEDGSYSFSFVFFFNSSFHSQIIRPLKYSFFNSDTKPEMVLSDQRPENRRRLAKRLDLHPTAASRGRHPKAKLSPSLSSPMKEVSSQK